MGFFDFLKRPRRQDVTSTVQLRPADGQGPYTQTFQRWIAHKVAPQFYEYLREAIPMIDAGIDRLVSLEGHLVVKGKNLSLVEEIEEWMGTVGVNDAFHGSGSEEVLAERGLQAFHQILSNEAFEQGFAIGEFVTDKARRDIVSIRVADSKTIRFKRTPRGLEIYQRADGDIEYRLLNPTNLLYFAVNAEAQNPYGISALRSMELCAKVLATIQNATGRTWERFGDPSYSIIYKTSKRNPDPEGTRVTKIRQDFEDALAAKARGQSADFIKAIDKDSDIEIDIIGADGQVLEVEQPARHLAEQIVAKFRLPPWMLGLHWSTTERLANYETEMVLGDVATRQAFKAPMWNRLVSTMLMLRGRTWKPGDWQIEYRTPNLHDVEAKSRSRFLDFQADTYAVQNAAALGVEISLEDLAFGRELGAARIAELPVKKKTGLPGQSQPPIMTQRPSNRGAAPANGTE